MNIKSVLLLTLTNILFVLAFLAYSHYNTFRAIKKEEARVVGIYEEKLTKAALEASKAEKKMLEESSKNIKDRDAKISRLNNSLTIALNSLQQRPSRPSDHSPNPEISCPSTGAELYREDGEFLTREAARADRIVAERDYYYTEYEKVRKQLEELRATNE